MISKQSIKLKLENTMNNFRRFWTVCITLTFTKALDLESCRYPLGIETGKILDSAFSSSSHANEHTIASKARIRSETSGWCPFKPISSNTYEYLQIDFENITVITLIELQGKYSSRPNEQYADAFRLEYRRSLEQNWIEYKDFSGQSILSGNSNSYIPTIRDILPSIIAKQIRIIPVVSQSRWKYICMRVEIYGCSYQDGLMSYSIPQGDKRGYSTQFLDEIYDGKKEQRLLTDGLGQLTDGMFGEDDYRVTDHEQIGYDWIGWKNRSSVNLLFYFDTYRNFTSIHLHTSNFFPHQIYLVHSVMVKTCADRKYYPTMEFIVPQDYTNASARIVEILLDKNSLITNCVNVTLIANNRSEWILISEIQFFSNPIISKANKIFLIRYWGWFFLLISLCLIFFISIIIYQIHSSSHRHHRRTNALKSSRSSADCNHSNPSSLSSISNPELHQHLMLSTTTDLSNRSDDLSSTINSYLSAISNPTMKSISSMEMCVDNYQPKKIEGPCGNSIYECLNSWNDFPKKCIQRWEDEQLIIGENYSANGGEHGTICQGYVYLHHPANTLKSILIKTLTTNDRIQKELFQQEHQLLNFLSHPNLVEFYGCTNNGIHALLEHSDLGDVHTYLSTSPTIGIIPRLSLITQLANALCYLESHQILHRDIAARNCLIYPNDQIKLTNSALASEQFQSHYYSINHCRLPLRWMSPESIVNNEFTIQSDIWSFGITLWEMMNHCRMLPYNFLNDDEVYRRLCIAEDLHLSKPIGVDKEVIDLMLECWRPSNQRPTFKDIAMFFNKRLDVV